MPEVLRLKLNQIRIRLRRMLWVGGLCAFLAAICGLFLAAAGLDRLLVGESLSGRCALTATVVLLLCLTFRRELFRPLSEPLGDLWIAKRIESKVPALRGSLASLVEFSSRNYSAELGSSELQRRGVDDALRDVVMLKTESLLNPNPVRWRIGVASVLTLLCLIFVATNPAAAKTALRRLVFPLKSFAWPRDVELEFRSAKGDVLIPADIDGSTFPRGTVWELQVVNRQGELPPDLTLHKRIGDRETEQPIPRELIGANEQPVGQIRLEMESSFAFRVTGGDDRSIPWMQVDVVPPPVLQSLSLKIQPPGYVDEPPRDVPTGAGFIEVTQGSTLLIEGEANTPLESARLASREIPDFPLEVTTGETDFSGEMQVDFLGPRFLSLQLTDSEQVTNQSAYRLEVVGLPDATPSVTLVSPASDLFLTPEAKLAIEVSASDDFGLSELTLEFLREEAEAELVALESQQLLDSSSGLPRSFQYQQELTLGGLGFSAGEIVIISATARDRLSTKAEHLGSDERRVTLLTGEQKQQELAGRLHELIDRINRERQNQLLLRDQTTREVRAGEQQLSDVLRSQKQIEQRLTGDDNSLQREVARLLEEAERNQIDSPVFEKRLEMLERDFAELNQKLFPALNQFLSRLETAPKSDSKSALETPPAIPDLADPPDPLELDRKLNDLPSDSRRAVLAELTRTRQERIADLLQHMSGDLDEWQQGQTLKDALNEMIEKQHQLARETEALKSQTLGKDSSQLSVSERAQLRELTGAQQENRQRLNQFATELSQQVESDSATESLRDLKNSLEESPAAALMSNLEQDLRDNHLGEAQKLHSELLEEMGQWDDVLNDRPITNAQLKLQFLKEQQQALAQLQEQQQSLASESAKAGQGGGASEQQREQFAREQQKLEHKTGRSERAMNRLELPDAEESLQAAREQMQRAAKKFQQNESPQSTLENAEDKLAEAGEQMARAERELQEEHLTQLLAELLPNLRLLEREQAALKQATETLRDEFEKSNRWNRPLLRELKLARSSQEMLIQRTGELTQPLAALESVTLALGSIERLMGASLAALDDRQPGLAASERMPLVGEHLRILIAVMDRAAKARQQQKISPQGGSPQAGEENDQSQDNTLALQLIVLRAVQEQIHLQMSALTIRQQAEGDSAEIEQEWRQLENEQTRVLDLLKEMLRSQNLPVPESSR